MNPNYTRAAAVCDICLINAIKPLSVPFYLSRPKSNHRRCLTNCHVRKMFYLIFLTIFVIFMTASMLKCSIFFFFLSYRIDLKLLFCCFCLDIVLRARYIGAIFHNACKTTGIQKSSKFIFYGDENSSVSQVFLVCLYAANNILNNPSFATIGSQRNCVHLLMLPLGSLHFITR